jgi:hypothetical protein
MVATATDLDAAALQRLAEQGLAPLTVTATPVP